MDTWIVLVIVFILIAGFVFLCLKTYCYIYILKNWRGDTVYVGWAKTTIVYDKILPKAKQFGLLVYKEGSFCLRWKKDNPAKEHIKQMSPEERPVTTKYDIYFDDQH